MKSTRSLWLQTLVVVLFGLVGGVLRFTIAANEQFWLDELHTGWVVGSTLGDVAQRAAIGNQNPLYFWMTWWTRSCFESQELSVRLVSILASLLVIPVSVWAVWNWTRSSVGTCIVAILGSVGTTFVHYGTEARPYAMLQLLGLVHFVFFVRWMLQEADSDSRPTGKMKWLTCFLLAIVSAMLVYTHVTSVSIFAAEVGLLVAWICFGKGDRKLVGTGIAIAFGLAALASMPIVAQNIEVYQRRGNWAGVSDLSLLWIGVRMDLALCFVVPLLAFALDALFTRAQESESVDNSRGKAIWLILGVALWAIMPVAMLVVAELAGVPMALPRYAQVGAVAFPIFAAIVIGLCRSRVVQVVAAALVVGIGLAYNPVVATGLASGELPLTRFENWQSPIEQINDDQRKKKHPVFMFSNLIEDVDAIENQDIEFQDYLRFPVRSIHPLDDREREVLSRPTQVLNGHFAKGDVQKVIEQGGAWILIRSRPYFVDAILEEVSLLFAGSEIPPDNIKVSVLNSPDSDVYLISVDW